LIASNKQELGGCLALPELAEEAMFCWEAAMARVFISHSSLDPKHSEQIKNWLVDNDFSEPFLDFDEKSGLALGSDWEKQIYREIESSDAMVLVLTDHWLASKWCFAEFRIGRALGKRIFPIIMTDIGSPTEFAPDIQKLDLRSDPDSGLRRLAKELHEIARDSPLHAAFSSRRPFWPGLRPFEEEDAAIYFGQENEIKRFENQLSSQLYQGGSRAIVILAASGSGKSSFLRAGIAPRLKQWTKDWIVLPPFRPDKVPLAELASSLVSFLETPNERDEIERQLDVDPARAVAGLTTRVRLKAGANRASIIVAVDQAEEMFTLADDGARDRFLQAIKVMSGEHSAFAPIFAMRSDFLDKLQVASAQVFDFTQFLLNPFPPARIKDIIEKPAKVAGYHIDPELVAVASREAGDEHALPLLAFALRALYDAHASKEIPISLAEYKALGDPVRNLTPIQNAVRQCADTALGIGVDALDRQNDERLQPLRRAFVPHLVAVNYEGDFIRKPALWSALPEASKPLLERLIDKRLLQRSGKNGEKVEVAHEALLKSWPLLLGWLNAEREFLLGVQQLQQELIEYKAAPNKAEALLRGLKLTRAENWRLNRADELSAEERNFIDASLAEAARQRNRESMRRRWAVGLTVFAILVLSVMTYRIYNEKQLAQKNLVAAESAINGLDQLIYASNNGLQNFVGMPLASIRATLEQTRNAVEKITNEGVETVALLNAQAGMWASFVDIYLGLGTFKDAEAAARQGLDVTQRMIEIAPNDPVVISAWAVALYKRGDVRGKGSDHEGRLADDLAAEKIVKNVAVARRLLWLTKIKTAEAFSSLGKVNEALEASEEALNLAKQFAQAEGAGADARRDVAISTRVHALAKAANGDQADAAALSAKALQLRQDLVRDFPANDLLKRDYLLALADQPDGADLAASLRLAKELALKDPTNARAARDVALVQAAIGRFRRSTGAKDAAAAFQDSANGLRELVKRDSDDAGANLDLAKALSDWALTSSEKDADDAGAEALRIFARLRAAGRLLPEDDRAASLLEAQLTSDLSRR
jgi:tetratricopeptide (TPR) repeat protein